MTTKQLSNSLLVAYADGELGSDDTALVEAAIAIDPALKARVDKFKKSGDMLKASFERSDQVVPDHIIHRFRVIEAAAKKKRRTTLAKTMNWPLFSWRSLTSIGGSFAAGLACAVFIISPGFMPASTDQGVLEQIVMRGAKQFEMPYIQQNGLDINNGEDMLEGSFTFKFKSPIAGEYSINEVTDRLDRCTATSQGCDDISAGNVREGDIVTKRFQIDDQDSLTLRVTISNALTTVEHNVSFNVISIE
jgi:hypothetical protein